MRGFHRSPTSRLSVDAGWVFFFFFSGKSFSRFLPTNRRSLLATLSVFQPIGVVVASVLGLAYIPQFSCQENLTSCALGDGGSAGCCHRSLNYGWRYLMWTIGGITMFVFLGRMLLFTFQESPKYLISKGTPLSPSSDSKWSRALSPSPTLLLLLLLTQEKTKRLSRCSTRSRLSTSDRCQV